MSHVKAGGGNVNQTKNMSGRRLGIKRFAGQVVINGTILVRQKGTVCHPGKNVKLSKDMSLYAVADGVVSFRRMTGFKRSQYYVDVLPVGAASKPEVKAVAKKETKVATKAVVKKVSPKKVAVKAVAPKTTKKVVKKVAKAKK